MKIEVNYEGLISAMLLKYGQVDPLDLSLIIDDMRSKYGIIHMESFSKYSYNNLAPYVEELKNGVIRLRTPYSLNDCINYDLEDVLLKDFLESKMSDFIKMYFDKLDYNKIKERKESLLRKDKVTKHANVLLLSSDDEHLKLLQTYGFKKINQFKSLLKADKYFKEHPEELESYDIVIRGKTNYAGEAVYLGLDILHKIEDLRLKGILIDPNYYGSKEWLDLPYETEFYTLENGYRKWYIYNDSVGSMLDDIVRCEEHNHIISRKKYKSFTKLEDKIAKELPLPTKKSDIKILLAIDTNEDITNAINTALKNMRLTVNVIDDNNLTLYKDIIKNLGDYDIIIASDRSKGIINLAVEACEQDKDTGRKLNLLLTYDEDICTKIDSIGALFGIATYIEYVYAYNFNNIDHVNNGYITAIKEKVSFDYKDSEYARNIKQKDYTTIISTVESAVCMYNDKLKELGYSPIKDLNFKSMEEYNNEFDSMYQKLVAEENKGKRLIEIVDEIKEMANKYLSYIEEGYYMPLNGLNITSTTNGIKIDNVFNGRVLCSVILSNNDNSYNIRVIGVQTLSKKGVLISPEIVKIDSKLGKDGSISKPTELQEKAIESIKKKMDNVLKPLLDNIHKKDKTKKYINKKR
jgi:hypothetical protein